MKLKLIHGPQQTYSNSLTITTSQLDELKLEIPLSLESILSPSRTPSCERSLSIEYSVKIAEILSTD